MHPITVSRLFVYPVKSARGIALEEARLTDRGFEHDRRFLITDRRGAFLTQRELPALALLGVAVAGDALCLSAPGMPPITAPLRPRSGAPRQVRIWGATCDALALGDELAGWLGAYLGVACELVYMPESSIRPVSPTYAHAGERVGFADAYPFLLTTEESVAELAGRLAEPAPMNRFRPNIVVRGAAPYAEDGWRAMTIGGVPFHVAKPSERCIVLTVDQVTGRKGKEPLATLAGYRKKGGKVLFGQYLLHRGDGVVRVGDALTLLAVS